MLPLSLCAVEVLKSIQVQPTGPVLDTTANALRCVWKRALKDLGIQDLRWHDLRHEAASRSMPPRGDANTRAVRSSWGRALRTASASPDNGTLCSLPAFMRSAGTVHVAALRSIPV